MPTGGCTHNPDCVQNPSEPARWVCSRDLPQVDGRQVRIGDYVCFRGDWVTDNAIHKGEDKSAYHEPAPYGFGLLKIGYTKTEFHPYFMDFWRLVKPPAAGDVVEEIHGLSAPVFNRVYIYPHTLNEWYGYASHALAESIAHNVTEVWTIKAPPKSSENQKMVFEHEIELRPSSDLLLWHIVGLSGDSVNINVSVRGTDINNPTHFRARYRVYWGDPPTKQLAAFYASEIIELSRLGTGASPDPNVHTNWARGERLGKRLSIASWTNTSPSPQGRQR